MMKCAEKTENYTKRNKYLPDKIEIIHCFSIKTINKKTNAGNCSRKPRF